MRFDGMNMGLNNLAKVSDAQSRSISAENFTGEKGKAAMAVEGTGKKASRMLGKGWKVSPSINVPGNTEVELGRIEGSGCIQHIWCTTLPEKWRMLILKIYWDGEENASVEAPLGDFFCNGWCKGSLVNSLPIVVNPSGGFNSYFPMPFAKSARIVLENLDEEEVVFFYQIDYILTEIDKEQAYFHAQFRKSTPVQDGVHTILDGVKGKGHYVGTYMAIQVNNNGWWGEGEIKFYLDGDKDYPTICGTGTEDYFGGAWNFEFPKGTYCEFSTPYLGLNQVIRPDGLYSSNTRFGMYRFHIMDPIRFHKDLKVTIQDLGWRAGGKYLKRTDDISTVSYWYQIEPHGKFPLPLSKDELEVI